MQVKIPATVSGQGRSGTLTIDVPAAATLRLVLDEIDRRYPGAAARIVDGEGRPHRYVNLYVNGDDVRHGSGVDTPVTDNDEVLILPAISGG